MNIVNQLKRKREHKNLTSEQLELKTKRDKVDAFIRKHVGSRGTSAVMFEHTGLLCTNR